MGQPTIHIKNRDLEENKLRNTGIENAQKDIAMGTQTPIESFILGHQEKETSGKDQERQAPLCMPNAS